ncbi:hypothetical protein [Paenibacillus elgii]|uniref:hypothetical protein n=1 Tax=Paenibacillus elgii TaxID=189691 RepID=UPI0007C78372|nr:hypothetical protein [Paenibacillus elgii]
MRGAPYSSLRNRYSKAFLLSESIVYHESWRGIPYHSLLIVQDKSGFRNISNQSSFLEASEADFKIGCVEIVPKEAKYEVTFKYSHYCGKPARYDKKYHLLAEKVFELSPGEYGRILYNGRHIATDTGEWYYELHILNAFHTKERNPKLFVNRSPLKEYKQLEVLF